MRKACMLCVLWCLPVSALAVGVDDEVARTVKACGKPLADRVDKNSSAAGGAERLLQYKGIELSFQNVEGKWVFFGANLPIGISNLNRAQTGKNLPCFQNVEGLKGVVSPGPVMPKVAPIVSPASNESQPDLPEPESKATSIQRILIWVAAGMLALSLIGFAVMKIKSSRSEN